MDDLISRQAVIDYLMTNMNWHDEDGYTVEDADEKRAIITDLINGVTSAQPTLYGYDIEHLMRIAVVLRKENLPPERVIEALTDIGRIASIVRNEFEESLRKAVEQCKI